MGRMAAPRPRDDTNATAPVASSCAEPITPTSDQPSCVATLTVTGLAPEGTMS